MSYLYRIGNMLSLGFWEIKPDFPPPEKVELGYQYDYGLLEGTDKNLAELEIEARSLSIKVNGSNVDVNRLQSNELIISINSDHEDTQ